jgi:hypothetical protein
MELLLNLLWVILALPALLVWRRRPAAARSSGIILLGCLLALLFPIVSVTDDLHPISAEIEECSPLKRTVKPSTCLKSPTCGSDHGGAAALPHVASFRPQNDAFGAVSGYPQILPWQTLVRTVDDRAPPVARS